MARDPRLPTWAPCVPQRLIRRLYETDARGQDEERFLDFAALRSE